MPYRLALALLALSSSVANARLSLGIFERWGAFRDETPLRCFAIAEALRGAGEGRPYATIATWPQHNVRGQLHIRLGRAKAPDAPVLLTIGNKRFALAAAGNNAWAPDARADAAITSAMRSATSMTVASRSATGKVFSESYALKGAATAMDAASLGCARQ